MRPWASGNKINDETLRGKEVLNPLGDCLNLNISIKASFLTTFGWAY